jgi:hypothetical protein
MNAPESTNDGYATLVTLAFGLLAMVAPPAAVPIFATASIMAAIIDSFPYHKLP